MDRFGDKLLHVHMGGYLPGGEEHRPMYCSREFVFRMFSLLAQRDYDGFIVGESDAPYQNVYELRMDALLFEAWRQRYDGDWSAVERSVGADAGAADAPAGGR
jgi:hypothetical protein